MKVLQVIGKLDIGGAETFLMNIYNNIDRKNIEIHFLVNENKKFDYTEEVEKLGGKIIVIESPQKIGMLNFIKKLTKLCKTEKYDVIHAHSLFNCGPCMFAAFLGGVKVRISHSHSTHYLEKNNSLVKKIYFFLAKILINVFSTKCIACGKEAGEFLYYKFRKFEIIKNGIDIDLYSYNETSRKNIRKKYNIPEKAFVIGIVGRLMYIKNHEFLINVFKEYNAKNNNSYLMIIGDGELKEKLQHQAKNLNLEEKIIFTGNIKNTYDFYNAFDIFALPSLFEGLPLVLIEAQTNGLKVLASNKIDKSCDITGTIDFLDIEDLKSWVNKIEKNSTLLRQDNTKSIIDNGYSIKNTVSILTNLYNKN